MWTPQTCLYHVCGVIFNVRIGKDLGLKNSVFYTRTVLTENNRGFYVYFLSQCL